MMNAAAITLARAEARARAANAELAWLRHIGEHGESNPEAVILARAIAFAAGVGAALDAVLEERAVTYETSVGAPPST